MTDELIDKIITATAKDLGYPIADTYPWQERELIRSIIKNYKTYVRFEVVEVYDFGDTLSESVWRKRQAAKESET